MAGSTTNIGLIKPTYSEDADVAIINENMDTLDSTISALDNGLAIVSNNNTHGAITAGQYVYVRNHGSLAEGMYTANSNIAANATLSSSNLTAVSSGSLNKLNSDITTLNGKIGNVGEYTSTTEGSTNVANESATKIAEIQPSAGRYLIIANISFPSSATGSRTASLSTDSLLDSAWWQSVQASPYGSTGLQVMRFATFDGTNSIKLVVRQTSGSTQSVTHRIFAIKLHE